MQLTTELDRRLPRLAWLAAVNFRRGATAVLHGASVETTDRFVVEGVWDGPFLKGEFAQSEAFFGSGLKIGSRGVLVSPSRALVDRVFSCETELGFVVANSLPLLLFATGASLAPGCSYQHETYTILRGIQAYDAAIPTRPRNLGRVRQHYYHPFLLTPNGCHTLSAGDPPGFKDYCSYVSFVEETLGSVLLNSRDPARDASLMPCLTLSRGYDSPTVAVLASRLIRAPAYTARHSNSWLPAWLDREAAVDDGENIAVHLGLPVRSLERGSPDLDERLFLAGGTGDPELIFGTLASDAFSKDRPTLLLTGYHGDTVWARDPGRAYLTPELRRGDTSGLSLSEVRLWAGFVNVAVPFIGARGIESIVEISRSPEMRPWSIGGRYDRPIPRRIVEEAGVPRQWFGQRKRAVVQTHPVPRTPALRSAFGCWLKAEHGMTLGRYSLLARASLVRWAGLRMVQKSLTSGRRSMPEPTRWSWVPSGDPASLLYRWAVSDLTGPAVPYPAEVQVRVRSLLSGSPNGPVW